MSICLHTGHSSGHRKVTLCFLSQTAQAITERLSSGRFYYITFSDSQKIMAAEKPAVALALAAGCSKPAGCSIENRQRC